MTVTNNTVHKFDTEMAIDEPEEGISVWIAALFLSGAMAGASIVAFPDAFLRAGWYAAILVIVMCATACLTGFQLSWCWTILQENWPEYQKHTRNPYPEIGYRAGGSFFKYFVQTCVILSMFGISVAFLILSSQNISYLLDEWFNVKINYCYTVLIITGFLLPISFLGTPKDFWPVALGAIGATAIAVILISIGTYMDMPKCLTNVRYAPVQFEGLVSAYCTICFAYGGHPAFPTIQHDMKKPALFPKSVLVAYIALFLLYFPMPLFAYVVYGDRIQGTIELNLSSKWVRDSIMVLITGHILFAFFIAINPVTQDLERAIGIPHKFTWKRICTRTFMIALAAAIGLSLPDFNTLLQLVGGTTIAATAFICPGMFYLMLRKKTQSNFQKSSTIKNFDGKMPGDDQKPGFFSHRSQNGNHIPCWELFLNLVVILVGILGAVATFYGVFSNWNKLSTSCFFNGMHIEKARAQNQTLQCWMDREKNDSSIFHNFSLISRLLTNETILFNNDTALFA